MDIFTPERNVFNPVTPRLMRDYKAIVNSGFSYGIHHCLGTWRHFRTIDKLKMGTWRVLRKFI